MRVSVSKGVFDAREPIPAVLRFRREEGDRPLPRDVRLRVVYLPPERTGEEVYPRSEPLTLPESLALPEKTGSEVSVELDLRVPGLFEKPGVYRVYVRHALAGPSRETNWQDRDLVVAHPVTFRIR
jgi:hypothetical protein